ncbi:MAG: flavodoxin [Deltaproteobacteria bacterium]|nr:MAG: flavodoxin [Desulfobacteraceae bacterium 4484_190.3]RLB17578.1 MAG: flavodoxin [Deltaproteobacteria bacterium]
MTQILIIYHSQAGHTEAMAQRVARGAESIDGVQIVLKKAGEATLQDLLECDGLAIGSPEYFGYMAGMIKDFFDRTYEPARKDRRIFKKPYVVFISAGNDGSGALNQIERICLGYPLKKIYQPVVAKGELDEDTLKKCEDLGKTIAAGCEAGIY